MSPPGLRTVEFYVAACYGLHYDNLNTELNRVGGSYILKDTTLNENS